MDGYYKSDKPLRQFLFLLYYYISIEVTTKLLVSLESVQYPYLFRIVCVSRYVKALLAKGNGQNRR